MEDKENLNKPELQKKQDAPTDHPKTKNKRKKENNLTKTNDTTSQNIKVTPQKKNNKKTKPSKKSALPNVKNDFHFNDIAHNKEASTLIHDLIKCFTNNSTLPKEELKVLNQTLFEKTVRVILSVLNSSVDKIFKKVLSSEAFQKLLGRSKIMRKTVSCQTDVSYGNS